jgi:hypothetical protein
MKSEPQNIEYRTAECRSVESLRSVFIYKIDRIQYFDIRYSLFDIRYSLFRVSSTIRLDARGQVCMKINEAMQACGGLVRLRQARAKFKQN